MLKKFIFIISMLFFVGFANANNKDFEIYEVKGKTLSDVDFKGTKDHVLVRIKGHKPAKEKLPYFILKLDDGLLAVNRYDYTDSAQYSLFITSVYIPEGADFAIMAGGLGKTIEYIFPIMNKLYPHIRIIQLNNIYGGRDMVATANAMNYMYRNGYSTYVADNTEILSGGAILFMGGRYRYAQKGAKIGIHSMFYKAEAQDNSAEFKKAMEFDRKVIRETFSKTGLKKDFFDFMMKLPSEKIHYLTAKELKKYNVVNVKDKAEFAEKLQGN